MINDRNDGFELPSYEELCAIERRARRDRGIYLADLLRKGFQAILSRLQGHAPAGSSLAGRSGIRPAR
ncbi:hypothetical protein [Arenibaculum sp.]|jgi:hypothetical protein|uniref:hypothetical protein n=1 Tax=Arenibaculum sp. TaxID=2865862 RepID=UPI002E111B8F|nr:hypothetical protein [Arenibaculum sp.]